MNHSQSRFLDPYIFQDLQQKMVFLGGPRQVGKTTLSRDMIAKRFLSSWYYNEGVFNGFRGFVPPP